MLKNNGSVPSEFEFECNGNECSLETDLSSYNYNLESLSNLEFKGTKPESGTVKVSNSGKTIVAENLIINGYTCNYINEKATCNPPIPKETLEKKAYQLGDAITLAGYNWHIIDVNEENLTLLMDAGQLGENNTMAHCTDDLDSTTDCKVDETGKYYIYSWDNSLIRKYLNETLYEEITNKINNKILPTEICIEPFRGDGNATYGGYLISELEGANCPQTVSDYIRLTTPTEYKTLTKSSIRDKSWLYSDNWWTMWSYFSTYSNVSLGNLEVAHLNGKDPTVYYVKTAETEYLVRPVITIEIN